GRKGWLGHGGCAPPRSLGTYRVSSIEPSTDSTKWRLPSVLWILLVDAHPLLTHRSFTGRDLTAYNLPVEGLVRDACVRGRLPVWTAEIPTLLREELLP